MAGEAAEMMGQNLQGTETRHGLMMEPVLEGERRRASDKYRLILMCLEVGKEIASQD